MPGIVGLISAIPEEEATGQLSAMLHCMLHESFYAHGTYLLPEQGCYLGWVNHKESFSDCNPIISLSRNIVLIFSGEHFAHQDATSIRGQGDVYDERNASHLLSLYDAKGD